MLLTHGNRKLYNVKQKPRSPGITIRLSGFTQFNSLSLPLLILISVGLVTIASIVPCVLIEVELERSAEARGPCLRPCLFWSLL